MSETNQIRINELARELEVKAKAIIDYWPEAGVAEKKTHSSSIELGAAEKVRKHFHEVADAEAAAERAAAAAEKAAKEAAIKAARARSAAPVAAKPSAAAPAAGPGIAAPGKPVPAGTPAAHTGAPGATPTSRYPQRAGAPAGAGSPMPARPGQPMPGRPGTRPMRPGQLPPPPLPTKAEPGKPIYARKPAPRARPLVDKRELEGERKLHPGRTRPGVGE